MTPRPNIVLFLTDDHGAWANGCYGNSEIHSPNLDALAQYGTRFETAYTPSPVCSPARACLLTGKTPSQVGIHDWLEEHDKGEIANRNWLGDTTTLFQMMSQAGYQTCLSGKWHMGQSHQVPKGVDEHFGLPYGQGAHNETYSYVHNGEFVELEGNKTQHITDHALSFIESAESDKPFFLCVGYIATHSPYDQQSHDPKQTARYQDADFTEIPPYQAHPWVKNEGTDNHPSEQDLRDRYIGYYASVTEIDEHVGRIVSALDMDNTIVIYTSDHGCAIGHHGFFGKGNSTRPLNMYEKSLHVPLMWRGAGIQEQQVFSQNIDHYDTFMTLCDVAGVTPADKSHYAGTSYRALLEGKEIEWDDTCYGEYGDLRMIRNKQWKLVYRYPDGPHELFDLQADPNETHNVFDENPQIVDTLKQDLDSFYEHYADEHYSGLRVKDLPMHNTANEAWRDGRREARGLQIY